MRKKAIIFSTIFIWVGLAFATFLIYNRLSQVEDISETESEAAGSWGINDLIIEYGETETVLDHDSGGSCEDNDVPDAPANFFIDNSNNVQLIATHYIGYRSIGDNIDNHSRDCDQKILSSLNNTDPRMYAYKEWLVSPYTLNGSDIYALTHNEYQGWEQGCSDPTPGKCWWNSVNLVISNNSGVSYTRPGGIPNHNVLNTEKDFDINNTEPTGYFEPSNIIKIGNYYYTQVNHLNPDYDWDSGYRGTCLMRTNNLADPSSWRLWDGTAFDFTTTGDHSKCIRVNGNSGHFWFNYNTYLEKYVSIHCHWGSCKIWISDDMINWEGPREINSFCMYASFIQPGDETRNFESPDRSPWLYYMSMPGCDGNGLNRDLKRTRIRFSIPGEENGYPQLDLRFSERKGATAIDSSFYANSGTISGTGHSWQSDSGRRILNAAVDTSISIPHDTSLNASGEITVSADINISSTPSSGNFWTVIAKEGGGTRNYGFYITSDGKYHFSVTDGGNGNYKGAMSNSSIGDGNWYNIRATYSDATGIVKFYLDNQADGQATLGATLANEHTTTDVIAAGGGFTGKLDRIQLLNYVLDTCTPSCTGKDCGPDGCGGSCGTCGTGYTCVNGTCTADCVPACTGKDCGDDGCGGVCGTCGIGYTCENGTCTANCVPACTGKDCGTDGCGGICGTGTCGDGYICNNGVCEPGTCTPDCTNKECGDDGCQGACPPGCDTGETCQTGVCQLSEGSPADIDGNGEVNMTDYYEFVQDYLLWKESETLKERSDLNGDQEMSMADYSIFVEEYLITKGL